MEHVVRQIKALAATPEQYSDTADKLVERIKVLIPERPEILDLEDAWGLFEIPGFQCEDLSPSYFQASWALGKAKRDYKHQPPEEKKV